MNANHRYTRHIDCAVPLPLVERQSMKSRCSRRLGPAVAVALELPGEVAFLEIEWVCEWRMQEVQKVWVVAG